MTDEAAIDQALSAVEAEPRAHSLMRRNGRVFMALPERRVAAVHTLGLYQPQRLKARLAATAVRALALTGLHRLIMPRRCHAAGRTALDPEFPACRPGTAGVMLGSPEHRVRRAILSYETAQGREVAKLAFGPEGREIIEGEAAAIRSLPDGITGIPRMLGVHHGPGFSLLRMPYERGRPFAPDNTPEAVALLESWVGHEKPADADRFPEWPVIRATLEGVDGGPAVIDALVAQRLIPSIRHGDFARWNLIRRNDSSVVVLDWEWGHARGMPGLDLAHYVLQDARLVARLAPADVVRHAIAQLSEPTFSKHLTNAGWTGSPVLPIIASLAWKQGAGHQDNAEILTAALAQRR